MMTKESDQKPELVPERVIRGGDGEVVGYWFPEDFWAYEEHLMSEHAELLDRVRAVPMGTETPRDLLFEMRGTFESFARSIGRKCTGYDITSSIVSVRNIARGRAENDKTYN